MRKASESGTGGCSNESERAASVSTEISRQWKDKRRASRCILICGDKNMIWGERDASLFRDSKNKVLS